MSGICGIVRFDEKKVETEEILKMLDAMKNHRNDTEGIWVNGNVGFGHRMLWTTPESLHEIQPSVSNDSNLVLTADARLDNREELIEKLEINKKDFDSITDTVIILRAYQKWGDQCLGHLMGDFAFAIWDNEEKKLFTARDRFGTRPFYFFFNKGLLYFSSYLDVLLDATEGSVSLNDESILSFCKFSTIKYEETMYENILRIPPAYAFIFSANGLKKERYWFPEKIKINYGISLEDASKKVHDLLFKAVESRIRVYGQWGCELSGGLDSSAVALIAKRLSNKQFKTFSMRYKSYSCDEWEYTNEVIHALKSDPVYIDVDCIDVKNDYGMNSLPLLSAHWPVYGSFIHNYNLGLSMINSDVRVCLTGHGGDHVFTGANTIVVDYLKNFKFRHLFNELLCSDDSILQLLNSSMRSIIPKSLKNVIKSLLFSGTKNDFVQPENFTDYWNIQQIKPITLLSNLQYIVGRHHVMHTDNNHYRSLEMNENIEFRHPFLDTKLVEYGLSLPNHYKYSCNTIKIVLREALKDIYPEKIYKREDKAEFSEVLFALMSSCDIQKLWKDSLLLNENLIDGELLNKLLLKYEQKIIDAVDIGKLWRLSVTALWLEERTKRL